MSFGSREKVMGGSYFLVFSNDSYLLFCSFTMKVPRRLECFGINSAWALNLSCRLQIERRALASPTWRMHAMWSLQTKVNSHNPHLSPLGVLEGIHVPTLKTTSSGTSEFSVVRLYLTDIFTTSNSIFVIHTICNRFFFGYSWLSLARVESLELRA